MLSRRTRTHGVQSHTASLGDRLIVAVILSATLLLASIAIVPRGTAHAAPNPNSQKENLWWRPASYDCTSIHCHSVVKWWAPYSGTQTTNTVVPIDCPATYCWPGTGGEPWHVNEAVWLADNGTCIEGNGKDCDSWAHDNCGQPQACWVEAGYLAEGAGSVTWYLYYRADQRPCGRGYYNHYGIDFRQDMWNSVTDRIEGSTGSGSHQCNGTTNNSWTVTVSSTNHPGAESGTSTANPMSPNEIQIGTEIYGNCCEVAPGNVFVLNWGVDNVNWFYLGTNYTTGVNAPMVGYWNGKRPADGRGGDWRTGCTGSGGAC